MSCFNQFTSEIYIFFFLSPLRGHFLAINIFFFNETKCRHPNKHLFSLTLAICFYYCRLSSAQLYRWLIPLASPYATAYYRPAPGRTDGIPETDERPRDNRYKSVFTNSCLVCQRNDKGIRQKSTKRVNSFIVCRAFCPGPPNRDPIDSEK